MDPRRAMAGVQLRYDTGLTGEEYVRAEAWRDARLERCPNHPHGGCSVARHGTYARKSPPGAKVPRWYCRESHTTISLLADCLAARLPGTLDAVEAVVVAAEGARSLEAAANELRRPADADAVALPGAMRWVRRRVRLVHDVLVRVIGLLPERLAGCAATMVAVARAPRERPRIDEAARPGGGTASDAACPIGLPTPWNRRAESQVGLATLDGA